MILAGGGLGTLDGGAGKDRIDGGAGRDVLIGGAGKDVFPGGTGNDVLYGDGDGDTFVFARGDGQDVVKGFDAGVDTLVLSDVTAADMSARAWGNGTLIESGQDGERIVLSGTAFEAFDLGAVVLADDFLA